MKRGKDEKMVEPMFPRLHVSDTEKGGPRAPPRNKMALYEQLSIPAQKFSHTFLPLNPNSTSANLVPHSSQGSGSERGMFSSRQQPPPRLTSDKQYSQFSDMSTPLTQNEQRKKLDDDDFRVPIFIHSRPSQECDNNMDREKFSHFSPPYFSHSLKFSKATEKGVNGHIPRQEPKNQKEDNSKEFVVDRNESVRTLTKLSTVEKTEDLQKQTCSSLSREAEDNCTNCIDLLKAGKGVRQELSAESQPAGGDHSIVVLEEHISAINNRKCSASVKSFPSEDQNIVHDLLTDMESCQDRTCRSLQMGNLDRSESVSETTIVDAVSGLNITPDDVVGMLGQKHFWKARRAITNQQRVFAVQVFELHRLIKVQRGMALSPHLLEDASALSKPIKATPPNSIPLDYPDKTLPYIPKQKGDLEKPSHKKENAVNNSVEKPSFSAIQTDASHYSIYKPSCGNSPTQSISSTHTPRRWGFNQPQGHQWLIPVMSPSEGLVYKPVTVPGFRGPVYGGCSPPVSNPMMGNFVPPAYGIPPPPPQYQLPSFPSPVPHGYFPPYSTPIISTAFSGSSVGQTNPKAMPGQNSGGEANSHIRHPNMSTMPSQNGVAVSDMNLRASEDIEVQASSASSRSERPLGNSSEGINVLPLFPTCPNIDPVPSCLPHRPQPECPPRVIKVVPHNSRSATESAARIFRSIQAERKQYDSM